jgi:ribosomal protein S18 acetylase RimI-like enzyme
VTIPSPREKDPSGQSSSQFVVRAVEQQDLSEISGILAESFYLQPDFVRWLVPVMRMGIYEDLRNRLKSAPTHYLCLVAFDTTREGQEGHHVGTVEIGLRSANPWQPRTSQYVYLSNLAVHPESRRRGVARQLLSACDRAVLAWGFQDIYLHVLENNHQARQLYFKSDYRVEEGDPNWGFWWFGQPRRLFLHKNLRDRKLPGLRG